MHWSTFVILAAVIVTVVRALFRTKKESVQGTVVDCKEGKKELASLYEAAAAESSLLVECPESCFTLLQRANEERQYRITVHVDGETEAVNHIVLRPKAYAPGNPIVLTKVTSTIAGRPRSISYE